MKSVASCFLGDMEVGGRLKVLSFGTTLIDVDGWEVIIIFSLFLGIFVTRNCINL